MIAVAAIGALTIEFLALVGLLAFALKLASERPRP
jgi:hypothetical protein